MVFQRGTDVPNVAMKNLRLHHSNCGMQCEGPLGNRSDAEQDDGEDQWWLSKITPKPLTPKPLNCAWHGGFCGLARLSSSPVAQTAVMGACAEAPDGLRDFKRQEKQLTQTTPTIPKTPAIPTTPTIYPWKPPCTQCILHVLGRTWTI